MSSKDTGSYMDSPAFQEAMGHFRVGRWEEGLAKLSDVEKHFPHEPALRAIRQEMEIRARISQYENEEHKNKKKNKLVNYTIKGLIAVVVFGIAAFAILTYSGWIQTQMAKAQSSYLQTVEQAQLTFDFRTAQNLMVAGKSDEALAAYEAIQAKNPEFPGLTDAMAQAQALKDVEVQYTQAMDLLEAGDSAQALDILTQISSKLPNYRDVSLQIKNLQSQSEMTSILQQAEQAFSEGRYEDAVSSYESLRLMNPTFQTDVVNENLFQSYLKAAEELLLSPTPTLDTLKKIDHYYSQALSIKPLDREALASRTQVRNIIEDSLINDYVNQAQAVLANEPDSLDAQQSAEHYLSQALGVRPNDPKVLLQFQLAQTYIQAISDFSSSNWDSVITLLEFVVQQQAGYANGTALQTLYDAYIARGSNYIASGEYSSALDDFQRAAVLTQQISDSASLAFESQVMVAEAQGLLNNYHEAVQIYQDALNTTGLRSRILQQSPLTDSLAYADNLANANDYQNAFYAYRNLIRNRIKAYDQSTVVTIKNGDYLSMLARRYNTTVAAILAANNMNNQPRLTPNTQLIIPTLP